MAADLQKLQEAMDAVWQPPTTLAKGIEKMLVAIDGPNEFPLQLLDATLALQLPCPMNCDEENYQAGGQSSQYRPLSVQ